MKKEIKKKNCKFCTKEYTPYRTTDKVCSLACKVRLNAIKIEKKKEKAKVLAKAEQKQLLEVARITFNKWIRQRDKKEKCICCGKDLGDNFQAGHFFSGGGHSAVLFDEDNVHAQRYECNNTARVNILKEFTEGLIERIGWEQFQIMKEKAYEIKRWEVDELMEIIKKYKL